MIDTKARIWIIEAYANAIEDFDMYTFDQVLAIAEFLGEEMTDEQSIDIMDMIRELSISDRERMLDAAPWLSGALMYQMSMHDAEMGGLSRY